MLDPTDRNILRLLKANSRLQWREIGEFVHLTGQAVANRVARLEKLGVIKGYTVNTDETMTGTPLRAMVTVSMKSSDAHSAFVDYIKRSETITRADRISGDGCYALVLQAANENELSHVLDDILQFGNYRVSISIGQVK